MLREVLMDISFYDASFSGTQFSDYKNLEKVFTLSLTLSLK